MGNYEAVSIPFATHFRLFVESCPQSKEDIDRISHVSYSSAIGGLMYAMVCTRPDLLHAVSVVSPYMHSPGKDHWEVTKWARRYVNGSIDRGLVFDRNKAATLDVIGLSLIHI